MYFVRVLFSRNFADAKFPENETLTKISEFTVLISQLMRFWYSLLQWLRTHVELTHFSQHLYVHLLATIEFSNLVRPNGRRTRQGKYCQIFV